MGFKVKDTAYFLVCNAKRSKDGFYGQMELYSARHKHSSRYQQEFSICKRLV